ncbi:E3 ubiquitin-protein ligase HECTD3-like [Rhopilema esculentum]|uniref:E3 ubiquitin-protein ligase HECTD3-like n=1 Tax=Rhopilema esculentum TaxID=499914 RepID=UPI0031E100D1
MSHNRARRKLARIRCVLETVKTLKDVKPLPAALCYVPLEIEYKCSTELSADTKNKPLIVRHQPSLVAKTFGKVQLTNDLRLHATGDEYSNGDGDWIKLTEKCMRQLAESKILTDVEGYEGWILIHTRDTKGDNLPLLEPVFEVDGAVMSTPTPSNEDMFGGSATRPQMGKARKGMFYRWHDVMEDQYVLHIVPPKLPLNMDQKATQKLQNPPPNWSFEADEELVRFLNENAIETYHGTSKRYIEKVEVSTEQEYADNLIDNDKGTYWESDGSHGRHFIRAHMKPGVIVQQLFIGVDPSDDNYMPYRVIVNGISDSGNVVQLKETCIDIAVPMDVCILENAPEYYKIIEIKVKECKDDGIDCRVHSVKVVSNKQKQNGLNRDLFDKNLVKYPKLDNVDRDLLYRRAYCLLRFASVLDSVIHFLLPTWEYTAGTFQSLACMRQLMPLSKKRQGLIDNCLRETQSSGQATVPKIFVNRHQAAEHVVNPSQDPDAKHSIFNQLYEALKPERCGCELDFRWSQKYDQWWECKFIGEGIIDQGGGFRDSLADIAEELCPSASDTPMPLPFFIRSPNQDQGSSNVNRDRYVPNPSCKLFAKYEWIGMVMGACLRGKESLVLALPSFIWKQLAGESVSWMKDYATVDASEVKLHETLETLDKETYQEKFFGVLKYSTVLSDGSVYQLKENGVETDVPYEERTEYMKLVQNVKMSEFNDQINSIRKGILKTIPQAVLDLLTWQELEKKICGDPEISVEALQKSAQYEDLTETSVRVKYLWQALNSFTNEDRSRFLRFVTGRRRLPTPLFICPSKSDAAINSLPESATCSNTLFLPSYSSAQVAEEKLRYAAYNCIAIDADMSPWEE